jgi:high-affinity iron transporter
MTYADVAVGAAVLGCLSGLLSQREPGLVATADSELAALDAALLATKADGQWQSLTAVSLDKRQHVDAATGALLETLAAVPDLLEVPPAH